MPSTRFHAAWLAAAIALAACSAQDDGSADAATDLESSTTVNGQSGVGTAPALPQATPDRPPPAAGDDAARGTTGTTAPASPSSPPAPSPSNDDSPEADAHDGPPVTVADDSDDRQSQITIVIDDRGSTPDAGRSNFETRNESGHLVTLDTPGLLLCAAAEGVLTAIDEGTDPADGVAELHGWADETEHAQLADAAWAVAPDTSFDGLLPVLTICGEGGYEL